ncbi:MAG: oligosaccharide flippase family protein [Chloroflexota bacterium]
MLKIVTRLGSLSFIYTLEVLLSRGIALLLLPIYAANFSQEDFGVLALVTMVKAVFSTLLPMGLIGVVNRFHHQFENETDRKHFYGSVWSFLIVIPAVIVFFLITYGSALFELLFVQVPFTPYIQLALLMALLNTSFLTLPPQIFRMNEMAFPALCLSLLQFLSTAVLTVYFLNVLDLGLNGAIYGQLLGLLITSIFGAVALIKFTKLNLKWLNIKSALAYSLPLVPHFFSNWALNASDRAILERFLPLGDVGIYSMGYQIGSAFHMIVAGLNSALIPMYSRAIKDKEEHSRLTLVATYYIGVLTASGLMISLLGGDVIDILAGEEFSRSTIVIPWIVFAYLSMGFYFMGMNSLTIISGKSNQVPLVSAAAAILNIIINIIFIPRYGIIAAAVSTAISYLLLSVTILTLAYRIHPINYEWERFAKLIISAFILYFIGSAISSRAEYITLKILIDVGTATLFPILLLLLNFFNPSERLLIHKWMRKIGKPSKV